MATKYQFVRGTEAENNNYVGPEGSLSVDLDNDEVRLHDGDTAGGTAMQKKEVTTSTGTQTVAGALDERTIYVDTLAQAQLLGSLKEGQEVSISGCPFKYKNGEFIPAGIVTPLVTGCLGEGADETVQFQELVNSFSEYGFDGLGKTYKVSDTIVLPKVRNKWKNLYLDGTAISLSGFTHVAALEADDPVDIGNLTETANKKGSEITLDSVTGLAVNDWVLLRSDKIMAETEVEGQSTRHSRACELAQVSAITGNVVSLCSGIEDTYTVSDGAKIQRIQTSSAVEFENVEFIGGNQGLYIVEGFESTYFNVRGKNQTTRGVMEERCYKTRADRWVFTSEATLSGFGDSPYGLSYTGCLNCEYGNVYGNRTRHLTTTGSASGGRGRTVSRNNTFGDIVSLNSLSSALDQHPGGGMITATSVRATFATNASQSIACQFQGAGGQVGSVHSSGGGAFQQDCFGFYEEGFTPQVQIGKVSSQESSSIGVIINWTNLYGTGQSQDISATIGQIDSGATGIGISINPSYGNVKLSIGPGKIVATNRLGLGRGIYTRFYAGYSCEVECHGTVLCAESVSATKLRVIQIANTRMTMMGGGLIGVGSNTDLLLTDGSELNLSFTKEINSDESLLDTSVIRRVSFT